MTNVTNGTLTKTVLLPLVSFVLLLLVGNQANAGKHEFFVSCADYHKVFMRIKYGDLDPGKEIAKVTAAKKQAQFHGNSCSASDYKGPSQCPNCEWEEFEAGTLNGDELTRLGQGDLTVIPEVIVGVPAKTAENVVKEGGRALKKLGKAIEDL